MTKRIEAGFYEFKLGKHSFIIVSPKVYASALLGDESLWEIHHCDYITFFEDCLNSDSKNRYKYFLAETKTKKEAIERIIDDITN